MAESVTPTTSGSSLRRVLIPLALAQFICSFAGSNMNVMINDISEDLDTTVQGVQTAITVFLLVMAALMIPSGKLTERWGRKRCFTIGRVIYGIGALMSAVSPGLRCADPRQLDLRGSRHLAVDPTGLHPDHDPHQRHDLPCQGLRGDHRNGRHRCSGGSTDRGLITTAISWRAAFVFQAIVVGVIVVLSRAIVDPLPVVRGQPFDTLGAVLSATGLVAVVMGVLAADNNLASMAVLLAVGAVLIGLFFFHIRSSERAGREPLLPTAVFRNRIANLGLVTQNVQWLLLMGTAFVVSAYLQVVRGYNAIQTGVIFTAATGGILVSSLAAERLAKRHSQRTLIIAGFITTIAGIGLLLALVAGTPNPWAFAPGLLLIGLGVGVMLTPSVNVVQSVFPEDLQGEISGLSRCISNLGSSLGTAVAGTILVAGLDKSAYAAAMAALAVIGFVGLGATMLVPSKAQRGTS